MPLETYHAGLQACPATVGASVLTAGGTPHAGLEFLVKVIIEMPHFAFSDVNARKQREATFRQMLLYASHLYLVRTPRSDKQSLLLVTVISFRSS
jgi:hypothetical protein